MEIGDIRIVNYITNDDSTYPFVVKELEKLRRPGDRAAKDVDITFKRGGVVYKRCRRALAIRLDEKTVAIYPDDCLYP